MGVCARFERRCGCVVLYGTLHLDDGTTTDRWVDRAGCHRPKQCIERLFLQEYGGSHEI